jgi:hypothetical protein
MKTATRDSAYAAVKAMFSNLQPVLHTLTVTHAGETGSDRLDLDGFTVSLWGGPPSQLPTSVSPLWGGPSNPLPTSLSPSSSTQSLPVASSAGTSSVPYVTKSNAHAHLTLLGSPVDNLQQRAKMTGGSIAGIAIGSAVIILATIFGLGFCLRRRHHMPKRNARPFHSISLHDLHRPRKEDGRFSRVPSNGLIEPMPVAIFSPLALRG